MDGDTESNIAHYLLQKKGKFPSEYLALSREERAFIIASTQIKIDADKKREKEIKRQGNRGRRGK